MTDAITALGLRNADSVAAPKSKTTLDQSDFLALMTAQLKNQDPTKPVDNAEYISQMAQFSTVTGISQTNANLATAIGGIQGTNTGIAQTNASLSAIIARLDALAPAKGA